MLAYFAKPKIYLVEASSERFTKVVFQVLENSHFPLSSQTPVLSCILVSSNYTYMLTDQITLTVVTISNSRPQNHSNPQFEVNNNHNLPDSML